MGRPWATVAGGDICGPWEALPLSQEIDWMGNPASLCSVHAGASAEGCRGGARALRGYSSPEARVRAGGEGELLKLPSLFPPPRLFYTNKPVGFVWVCLTSLAVRALFGALFVALFVAPSWAIWGT